MNADVGVRYLDVIHESHVAEISHRSSYGTLPSGSRLIGT